MKIKVFGILSDIVGSEIELQSDLETVNKLRELLNTEYPAFQKYSFEIAVNHTVVDGMFTLKQEDEIALLPPFTGG